MVDKSIADSAALKAMKIASGELESTRNTGVGWRVRMDFETPTALSAEETKRYILNSLSEELVYIVENGDVNSHDVYLMTRNGERVLGKTAVAIDVYQCIFYEQVRGDVVENTLYIVFEVDFE